MKRISSLKEYQETTWEEKIKMFQSLPKRELQENPCLLWDFVTALRGPDDSRSILLKCFFTAFIRGSSEMVSMITFRASFSQSASKIASQLLVGTNYSSGHYLYHCEMGLSCLSAITTEDFFAAIIKPLIDVIRILREDYIPKLAHGTSLEGEIFQLLVEKILVIQNYLKKEEVC